MSQPKPTAKVAQASTLTVPEEGIAAVLANCSVPALMFMRAGIGVASR